jgi:GT2 family glycosyltransferase
MPVRLSVGIATTGRSRVLLGTLRRIASQSRPPDDVFIAAVEADDVEGAQQALPGVKVLFAPRGLPRQRNAILTAAKDGGGGLVFFDDDFLPSARYLERAEALLTEHSDIAGLTGDVLADGVRRGGLASDAALERIEAFDGEPMREDGLLDVNHLYGCNMVVRAQAAVQTRFDERLPLYGWQEDRDFSVRLRAHGRTVRALTLAGIHLGVVAARQPGARLGYSQVANPLYLCRKGTMGPLETTALVGRNVAANLLKTPLPEPWVDRRGRLLGNLKALSDAFKGVDRPERMLEL